MYDATNLTEEEMRDALAYVGLVLIAFELVKSMIVNPIRAFYQNTTFGDGMTFKSYEADVLVRHKDQFEACLLYLRDFMEAIDADDMDAIQQLRRHRNELAHHLVNKLHNLQIASHSDLFGRVDVAIFKLSNYRAYIEIGSDPEFKNLVPDWSTLKGQEYVIFESVRDKLKLFG